ncbi:MAG: tetratricopeptide repeat protein [Alphaproteobacteria bacterium]|nr:tetratricopeptide repeat protein [Alphaproteobacteria bacterium]
MARFRLGRRDRLLTMSTIIAVGVLALGALLALLPDRGVVASLQAPAAEAQKRLSINDHQPAFDRHFKQGVALLRAGKVGEAYQVLTAASAIAPNVPEALVNLGFAAVALERAEEAEAAFLRAIEIRPEQRNAYFGLAESRELQGDHRGAVHAMSTFLHLTPEDDPFRRRADAAIWEWRTMLDAETETASEPDR